MVPDVAPKLGHGHPTTARAASHGVSRRTTPGSTRTCASATAPRRSRGCSSASTRRWRTMTRTGSSTRARPRRANSMTRRRRRRPIDCVESRADVPPRGTARRVGFSALAQNQMGRV